MIERTINDLRANPKNPRSISKDDFEALKKSIEKFGDLGGIVFNVTTNQLVGGHQRTEAFRRLGRDAQIVISEQLAEPDKFGTAAYGYVILDGAKYSYREVAWSQNWETAANIAANRIGGEFDLELLAQANYELSQDPNGQDLLALTGQTNDEINKLLNDVSGEGDDDKYTKEIVAPTYEPSNEKPNVADLMNLDRTNKLLAEIETAAIPEPDKQLLRLAAYRHNVFDYAKIADYYAHSSPDVQNLMENSALVIIDYNKAVERGYVEITKDIMKVQSEDYPGDEE